MKRFDINAAAAFDAIVRRKPSIAGRLGVASCTSAARLGVGVSGFLRARADAAARAENGASGGEGRQP
jgi:hypothetical protein